MTSLFFSSRHFIIALTASSIFSDKSTETSYNKNSYISGVIKSLKTKIDAPVKRKKAN